MFKLICKSSYDRNERIWHQFVYCGKIVSVIFISVSLYFSKPSLMFLQSTSDIFPLVYCSVLLKLFLIFLYDTHKYAYNFEHLLTIFEGLLIFCQFNEDTEVSGSIPGATRFSEY